MWNAHHSTLHRCAKGDDREVCGRTQHPCGMPGGRPKARSGASAVVVVGAEDVLGRRLKQLGLTIQPFCSSLEPSGHRGTHCSPRPRHNITSIATPALQHRRAQSRPGARQLVDMPPTMTTPMTSATATAAAAMAAAAAVATTALAAADGDSGNGGWRLWRKRLWRQRLRRWRRL